MRFAKYHALGNDYLVLEPKDCPALFSPEAIRKVCHRHFGLGSDGILYGPIERADGAFGLRILNPEKAVEALEEAYKMDQANSRLRARIAERLLQSQSSNAILTTFNEVNIDRKSVV